MLCQAKVWGIYNVNTQYMLFSAHSRVLTSWIMPMNSEKAQLSWFRTLLRKEAAMSLSILSSSAMCLCSSNDGHGSKPIRGGKKTGKQTVEAEDTRQQRFYCDSVSIMGDNPRWSP